MDRKKLDQILELLKGVKYHEWESIARAVNQEYKTMSNRLELTDISKIKRSVELEIIQ